MRDRDRKLDQHEQWHQWLAEQLPVFRAPFQNKPVEQVQAAFRKLTSDARGIVAEIDRPTFRVYCWLYVLHVAERTIMFYSLRPVAKDIAALNDFVFVQLQSEHIMLDHQTEVAARLAKYSFHMPQSPVQWLTIYRFVWSTMLTSEQVRQNEYERLVQLQEKKSRDAELRQLEMAAATHFLVMAGQLEEALQTMMEEKLKPSLFFDYLKGFDSTSGRAMRAFWLRGLSKLMNSETSATVSAFLQEWLDGTQSAEEQTAWLEAAIRLLPTSLKAISAHYVAFGAFERWADLYMALGLLPWDEDHLTYVQVHKEQPSVLLPLYHQSIEAGIESKSRTGYRDAVKWMKVVRSIYIQLEQVELWHRYFSFMMERTGRLRAFQEELAKGGLSS